MSRKEFSQIVRRPNKSGIAGVTKVIKLVRGKKYVFWQATWSPKTGLVAKKAFSLDKYGPVKAKRLAVQARKKALSQMAD